MHTLVNNLLDMARIQRGEIRLKMDWHSLEEVVGSAIRSLEPLLAAQQDYHSHPRRFATCPIRRGTNRKGAGQPVGKRSKIHTERFKRNHFCID